MNERQEVVFLHLDDIIPNRFQPREVFDEKALKELAVSIKEHGVIHPIIVRKINDSKYEIIAGERRYKAAALAGLTSIPAIIRNLDDQEAAKVALLENLQRRNLNPIEEARTYQKIIELDQMTQEELAKTMGKSQSAVANKLRLLALSEEVQKSLLKEEISERHARALLNLNDHKEQVDMLKKVIKQKMTVRQLENEIKNMVVQKDEIKDDDDLASILNPKPVSIEKNMNNDNTSNNINSNNIPDFLMKQPQEDTPPLPKIPSTNDDNIINYGEIDDEEEEEIQDDKKYPDLNGDNSSLLSKPIDLMDLKTGTKDIANINDSINNIPPPQSGKSDLDSLLNMKPDLMANNDKETNKFTPAEEALRESENKNYDNKADYFSAPNLMSIELPTSPQAQKEPSKDMFSNPSLANNSLLDFAKSSPKEKDTSNPLMDLNQTLFQKSVDKKENSNNNAKKSLGSILMNEALKNPTKNQEEYNIQQMVNEIRKTLKELESHGAKIDTDEMNFENQYQILIKIDKNSNY